MGDRLRVVRRRFRYPVGASVERVRAAGGLSRMRPEDVALLVFRDVGPGEDCSDMPAASAVIHLQRGDIERVSGGGTDE